MKNIVLTAYLLLISFVAFSQKSLKMTKMKSQSYSSYNRKWNGWPTDWTYYSRGREPILKMIKLDDTGRDFKIELWANDEHFTFYVNFDRYDSKNSWYVYTDNDGDEISILGTTLSSLCENG